MNYRDCAGIVLINKNNLILICKRIDAEKNHSHQWQMPQGGIDANEYPLDAAKRELAEETGIKSVSVLSTYDKWLYYDLPKNIKNQYFRGQRQKWFLMRFLGLDSEINLNQIRPEFSEYRWVTPQEVIKSVVPFKKMIYETVINEFVGWLK